MPPCTSRDAMQNQSDTREARPQRAQWQLAEDERKNLHASITCMKNHSDRLLEQFLVAEERRKHAERMLTAVEIRLDILDEQAEALLVALEALVGAVNRASVGKKPLLLQFAFDRAWKLVDLYGPSQAAQK